MNSQRNAKGRIFLSLVLALLLCAAGCQAESGTAGVWLAGDSLSQLEALYGQDMDAVLEELSLTEAEVTENEIAAGVWDMAAAVPLAGQDFTQSLLFDVNAGTLYGRWYQCSPLGTQEALSVVEEVWPRPASFTASPSPTPVRIISLPRTSRSALPVPWRAVSSTPGGRSGKPGSRPP